MFGLGALLWALLAGQSSYAPTRIPDREELDAPTATILARLGRLPAAIELPPQPILDLVATAMAIDVNSRPANAAAFVTELRRRVDEAAQWDGEGSGDPLGSDSPRPLTRTMSMIPGTRLDLPAAPTAISQLAVATLDIPAGYTMAATDDGKAEADSRAEPVTEGNRIDFGPVIPIDSAAVETARAQVIRAEASLDEEVEPGQVGT